MFIVSGVAPASHAPSSSVFYYRCMILETTVLGWPAVGEYKHQTLSVTMQLGSWWLETCELVDGRAW